MATNTGGGTTASLSNTPQAQDDSFVLPEDYNSIKWLDVMANDLGGNAKILWSLDNGPGSPTDLISSDIGKVEATTGDTSLNGAKIWIANGQVGYDALYLNSGFRAQLQALAVGEKLYDSFTYAIRLANGTLSWGTATIVYTGSNDGPLISAAGTDKASICLAETNAPLSASGTLTVVDPDTSDKVTMSVTGVTKSGNAGSLDDATLKAMLSVTSGQIEANVGDSHNVTWNFASTPTTFDYLACGESLTLNYTVQADDGHGGMTTQTVTVKVEGTNDGPTLAGAATLSGTVKEDSGTYTANGSFGFGDLDSSDHHSVSVAPGGSGYLGTFTPSVSDDSTGDGAGTVSWNFNVNNSDLQFLAKDETRTQTYTITLSDGHGGTINQTVTVVLTGCEDPVVVTSAPQAKSVLEEGTNVGGTITFNDVDLSDTHTASATAHAGNATSLGTFSIDPLVTEAANAATGSVGWTYTVDNAAAQYLAAGESAVEKYDVTFDDGHGGTVTEVVTVTITGSNDPVVITAGDVHGDVTEDSGTYSDSGSFGFTDVDLSDVHSVSVAPDAAGYLGTLTATKSDDATGDGAGSVGWSFSVANADLQFLGEGETRTQTYTVTVDDSHGGSNTQTVTVVLTGDNDPVVITSGPQAQSISEDGSSVGGSITFSDVDLSDTHSASAIAHAGNLTSLGTFSVDPSVTEAANAANGSVGWTYTVNNAAAQYLAVGESAVEKYDVTFNDGHGGTVTEVVTVTITGSNDKPVAVAIAGEANEDGPAVTLTASFTDVDASDGHTFTIDTTGTVGSVTNNGNGTFSYDPNGHFEHLADGQTATDTFTYTVDDGHGGTSTKTATVTIHGQNDAPTASATNNVSTDEDTASAAVSIGATDVDDGAVLSYALKSGGSPAHGSVSFDQNAGTFVYTPAADYNGPDGFTIVITDDHGATKEQAVTVMVNPVADIANDTATTNEDTPVTTNVLANDSFEGSPSVTGVTQGAHGSVVNNNDGTVTYTPNADYNGSDSYTYTVTSGGVTETATVNVTINAVADAVDDSATTNEDNAVTTNVLANDSFEGSPSVTGVTQGAHGTVVNNNDGTVTYTPNADYNGSDAYTYTVTSGGVTETATVNVTVNAVADIANDSATTNEDTAVTTSVLANDSFEGSPVVTAATDGAHGTVTFNGTSTTYTPNADFNGTDSYTYTVTSGGVTETATVNVTVNAVADIVNDSVTTDEDNAVTTNVLANDNFEGSPSVTAVTQGAHGSVANNNDGTVTYTPNANYNGPDSYTYTVTSGGVTETATVSVTVSPVNDAPIANNDSVSTGEDTPVNFDVRANDSDVDGDSLTVTKINGTDISVGSPVAITGGSISLLADGTLTYTPDANFNGTPSFTYTVSDGNGGSADATVNLTVNAVNDAPVATITPLTYSATEQTTLHLHGTGLSISDVDAGSSSMTVTLAVTEGVITIFTGSTGVGVSNSGTSSVTITGTVTQINDLLAGNGGATVNYFDGPNQFDGYDAPSATATLTMTVHDNGNTGGGDLSSSDTATINITAVNDAPVATIAHTYGVIEQQNLTLHGTGLSISDVDAANGTMTVTLSVTEGVLNVAAGTSGALVSNSGTSSVTITGSQSQINDLLAGGHSATVVYNDNLDNPSSSVTLSLTVHDNGNTGGGDLSSTATTTITVAPVNDDPTLGAVTAGSISEVDQSSSTTSSGLAGTLSGADVDGDTLTYGIQGGSPAGGNLVSLAGSYGTLTVDTVTGAYSYVPVNAAVEGLDAGENPTDSFTVTVSDGHGGLASRVFSVNLHGADDAPTLDAVASGSITEVVNSSSTTSSGLGGNLVGHDVDVETLSYGIQGGSASGLNLVNLAGSYGTLTVNTVTGAYTYTQNAGAIDTLSDGQHAQDSFTVTVSDGDAPLGTQTYTVNLTGANDQPDIRIDTGDTGSVILPETNAPLSSTGKLTVTDVDANDTISVSNVYLFNVTGSQGSITDPQLLAMFNVAPTSGIAANAGDANNLTWTFNSTPQAFDYLAVGQSVILQFGVEVSDGHGGTDTEYVSVKITGSNDVPTVTGALTSSATEGDASYALNLLSGASDKDSGETATLSILNVTYTVDGGSPTGTAPGGVSLSGTTLTVDPNNAAFDPLNTGQSRTIVVNYDIKDAQGATVHQTETITINGVTDVPLGDPNDFDNLLSGSAAAGPVNIADDPGSSALQGSNFADTIHAGNGNDSVYGHDGNDQIFGEGASDVSLYGQAGDDTISGGVGADTIYGGSGNDTLYGYQAPTGATDNQDGGDTIYGGSGDDFIYGQTNNDTLIGGYGADTMTGADGSDVYQYWSVNDAGDTITDFTQAGGNGNDSFAFRLPWSSGGFSGGFAIANQVAAGGATMNTLTVNASTGVVTGSMAGADVVNLLSTDHSKADSIAEIDAILKNAGGTFNGGVLVVGYDAAGNVAIYYDADANDLGGVTLITHLSGVTDTTSIVSNDFAFLT
jgi:VCBS repeat-containing protein